MKGRCAPQPARFFCAHVYMRVCVCRRMFLIFYAVLGTSVQTSSLLHILGSDLFHGALDGEGGNDEAAGRAGSARPVGRLDELNGSVYVAPGDKRGGAGMERRPLAGQAPFAAGGYAQGSFQAHGAGGRPGHGPGAGDPRRGAYRGYERGYDRGYDLQSGSRDAEAAARAAAGEQGKGAAGMANGTHGHWMPEHGGAAPGNYRGRGQGPQGAGGPPRRGGAAMQWHGPAPTYGGAGGRGGSMNAYHAHHMRGGGPEVSAGAGGPVFKPSAGVAGVAPGRGADARSQQYSAAKGPRAPVHAMHQMHQPLMNGRADARNAPVARMQQMNADAKDLQPGTVSSAVPIAAADGVSGPAPGTAPTVDADQHEEAQDDSTSGASAAEKEAADKARREAKKKSKKEKQRKGKEEKEDKTQEDKTPSSSCTPVQGTPVITPEVAPEQPPTMLRISHEAQEQASSAADSSPELAPSMGTSGSKGGAGTEPEEAVAKEKVKGSGGAAKQQSQAPQGGGPGEKDKEKEKEKAAKVTPPAAKKQKETANKKSHQQQKNQNAQVLSPPPPPVPFVAGGGC